MATRLDRTNRNNAFYQIRASTRAAFDATEVNLSVDPGAILPAMVLYASKELSVAPNTWGRTLESQLQASLGIKPRLIEEYKIYFRVELLHAYLPLPPSFRNVIPPKDFLSQVTPQAASRTGFQDPNVIFSQNYTGDSDLNPWDEEVLLISCHPSLRVSMDPSNPSSHQGRLNPGDLIEVKFSDSTFSSAKIEKVVSRGLNIIKPIEKTIYSSGLFDEPTLDLADLPPGPGAGSEKEIETKFPEQFSLENMLRNSGNLANLPNDKQFDSLQLLVEKVLDPIQTKLNEQGLGEIYITSGFRNEEVNKKAGGVKNSKHTFGYTTDMRKPAKFANAKDFSKWIIDQGIDWRGQLIWYDVNKGGHVHIDYIENSSEKRYLHAYGPMGKTLYEPADS